jgi:hypothetical protein
MSSAVSPANFYSTNFSIFINYPIIDAINSLDIDVVDNKLKRVRLGWPTISLRIRPHLLQTGLN